MANVAGLLVGRDGAVLGFQADLSTVTVFTLPGQTHDYFEPRLVELVDSESYGAIPDAAGDSTKTAAERLAAFQGAGTGPTSAFVVNDIGQTTVGTTNPVIKRDLS